jgi:phosphate transport system permease protein
MTMVTAEKPQHRPLTEVSDNARKRARKDRAMRAILLVALFLALIPLGAIIVVTTYNGLPALNLEFFTELPPFRIQQPGGGYASAFVGTLYMVAIAIVLAVPLGILGAIYLVEFSDSKLVPATRFFTDVMTGVPSIFVGVFVLTAFVRGFAIGWSPLAGGIALAILMLPIVVRSGEEVLKLVPQDLRNGAYALGSRRWQSVLKVVLPAAGPGLATGTMLAIARAAGETAPLLLTAVGLREIQLQLFERGENIYSNALTLQAFAEARTFAPAAQSRGWAGAFSLIVIVLLLNLVARAIGRRSTLRS